MNIVANEMDRDQSRSGPVPEPVRDWITQRSLAAALGISQRTASLWAKAGRLHRYEHGMPDRGRRKYSRALVERELRRRWEMAISAQDALMEGDGESSASGRTSSSGLTTKIRTANR